jgi:type IV pilus assembly protein PilA
MTSLKNRRGGFTLIELMIVVAIIGILAAIAIPNFLRFQLRAKSSEGKTNLAAIRTAEEGYFSEFGVYVASAATTPPTVTTSKTDWPGDAGFDQIGWSPEGDVYFQYNVATAGTPPSEFLAEAGADIDGNGTQQAWAYVKPVPGASASTATAALGCSTSGVYNPVTGSTDLIETVGPCDSASGQSEF